jgi:hypothetical protein
VTASHESKRETTENSCAHLFPTRAENLVPDTIL